MVYERSALSKKPEEVAVSSLRHFGTRNAYA